MDQLADYVAIPITPRGSGVKRLALYVALAALLLGSSLIVNLTRTREAAPHWIIRPGSSSACTTPPNGFAYTNTVDGTTMQVCVSQEGNINGFFLGNATNQIAWDGYCLFDSNTSTSYTDYSPGSGVSFSGWGAATMTVAAPNQVNMTRQTLDGKYQLTEFIKMNFQPRSVFVGMTIKNVDPANVTHNVEVFRSVAPSIDGSASDDEYNQFGVGVNTGATQYGRTGQAYGGTAGNSLLFGPTQKDGAVTVSAASTFPGSPCVGIPGGPGHYGPGTARVLVGFLGDPSSVTKLFTLAPNASVNGGKFVYRMV